MKREILFTGQLSYSKTWVKGNLIEDRSGNKYIIPFNVFEPDGHHLIIDSDSSFRVDPKTVCQYAGFSDNNGKGVFEGDYDKDGNYVVFCDECHGWQFGEIDIPTKQICITCHNCDGNFMIGDWIDKFEVIGNIHDNPELL